MSKGLKNIVKNLKASKKEAKIIKKKRKRIKMVKKIKKEDPKRYQAIIEKLEYDYPHLTDKELKKQRNNAVSKDINLKIKEKKKKQQEAKKERLRQERYESKRVLREQRLAKKNKKIIRS